MMRQHIVICDQETSYVVDLGGKRGEKHSVVLAEFRHWHEVEAFARSCGRRERADRHQWAFTYAAGALDCDKSTQELWASALITENMRLCSLNAALMRDNEELRSSPPPPGN